MQASCGAPTWGAKGADEQSPSTNGFDSAFFKRVPLLHGSAPFVFYGKKSRKRMLWGRKRPRERTPVVWRQDAFPFFYSIWESARGSVFLARRADKTHATAGNSFLCFQYIICGRICQGEIENSGSVQNREVGQRTEGKKSRKNIAARHRPPVLPEVERRRKHMRIYDILRALNGPVLHIQDHLSTLPFGKRPAMKSDAL